MSTLKDDKEVKIKIKKRYFIKHVILKNIFENSHINGCYIPIFS